MANRRELMEQSPERLKVIERLTDLVFRFPNISNFSSATGVSTDTVENWLNADTVPSTKILYRLCCEFRVSMDWILGHSDYERHNGLCFTESDEPYKELREHIILLVEEWPSVADFANRIQIGKLSVYRWIAGDAVPNTETVCLMCQRCGVSADWLFGLDENPGGEIIRVREAEE